MERSQLVEAAGRTRGMPSSSELEESAAGTGALSAGAKTRCGCALRSVQTSMATTPPPVSNQVPTRESAEGCFWNRFGTAMEALQSPVPSALAPCACPSHGLSFKPHQITSTCKIPRSLWDPEAQLYFCPCGLYRLLLKGPPERESLCVARQSMDAASEGFSIQLFSGQKCKHENLLKSRNDGW